MSTLTEMREERARVFNEIKALVERGESEERDFNTDEQAAYDKMNAEIDELGLKISQQEREERLTSLRASLDVPQPTSAMRPKTQDEKFLDDFSSFLRGEIRAFEVNFNATDDRDVHRAYKTGRSEYRDLLTTGTGANAIPVSFVRSLREHMIENSAIRQTNATVLVTQSGEALKIPKTTAHPAANSETAEAAAITENDPTFAQVTLDAYKYTNLEQLSNEFVTDEAINVLEYLARANGQAIGNAAGARYVVGTGTGQPRGVMVAAATGKTGGAGQTTTVTGDDLIDLQHSVVSAYRRNAYWLMADGTAASIRKLKGSDGQYLWQQGLQAGMPDTILGRPVVTDPNVAAMAASADSIAFGDFSGYYIRDVGSFRFERSDDFAFNTDLITFRAILRTDGDLVDENAIKTYTNAAS